METALAMLNSKRYLYVGFMVHQTIEKIFKAYYTFLKSETAPFSHSLSYLAKKGDFSTIRQPDDPFPSHFRLISTE